MASRRRLLALNDPRLSAYLAAEDDGARGSELEGLLTDEVQPRVRAVLAKYARTDWPLGPQDAEDILGQVTLRVLRKLRAATVFEEESVQNLEAYVTTLTRNSVRDFMRRRTPERTRLKSRLRYLFTHDRRLALWNRDGVAVCGLPEWIDSEDYESAPDAVRGAVQSAGDFWETPSEAAVGILSALRKPVRLGDLVSAFVHLAGGGTAEQPSGTIQASAAPQRDALEARQYLQILWREIRDLPPRQRAALLLNLREPGSGNAVTLFVSVGIATLEEIAAAVDMSRAELSAIWEDLPLDDLRIAKHFGLQRQQVINLRKSARERLSRRMSTHSRGRQ